MQDTQIVGVVYFDPLFTALFTLRDYDSGFRDFKAAGEEFYQMFIGAPLQRRGSQADLEAVTVRADNFV
jgi:hypothetical protein